MWEHIWYRELQAAPSELPALLTQPPTTPGTVWLPKRKGAKAIPGFPIRIRIQEDKNDPQK